MLESTDPPSPTGSSLEPRPNETARARRVSSRELLGPCDQLLIEHQGREYRLQLTRGGKLILTA